MDLKALIAKMDQIEGKTILDEDLSTEGYYDLNDEGMQPIDLSTNPSFKEIVNRYSQLYYQSHEGDYDDEESAESDAIEQYVAKRFGEKGSAHLQKAAETSRFGRDDKPYGRDSRSSNLGYPNQRGADFRTTKAGKMHGQDAKVMKNKVSDRLGRHPEPNLPEQSVAEGFPTVADAKARADKEKTTGKFDKKELSTGTQYTRKSSTFDDGGKDSDTKKAEKKKKNEGIEFHSSIARGLVEEFGYEVEEDAVDERVTINPDGTTSGGIAPAPAATATSPWANDPAKDAAWKALSPEDQKWLGGADPTDEFILARAPNKGKPAAPAAAPAAPEMTAADQDDADMGAAMTANAAAAPTAADQDDADMGAAMTANAAQATQAAPTIDPAKLKRFQELLAKANTPAVTAPATGAATKPAATGFANTGGGAAVGNPNMAKQGVAKESVTFEDDKTLLAIKNIKF